MTAKTQVDMRDVARSLCVVVKVRRAAEFQWRFWLGARLMKLAKLVMGCEVEFEITDARQTD